MGHVLAPRPAGTLRVQSEEGLGARLHRFQAKWHHAASKSRAAQRNGQPRKSTVLRMFQAKKRRQKKLGGEYSSNSMDMKHHKAMAAETDIQTRELLLQAINSSKACQASRINVEASERAGENLDAKHWFKICQRQSEALPKRR